jgi:molybdenum cofactor synthesis domain-containing protein
VKALRAGVLTISTSKAAGEGVDESGPRLDRLARALGARSVDGDVVADERAAIEQKLLAWSDAGCELVLTSGGTGLTPDDVTPEATRAVIEREIPGIGEAIRLASRPHTENWMLSRATAGVRGATLIVNLPGSPRAIDQVGRELAPALRHALALLAMSPA